MLKNPLYQRISDVRGNTHVLFRVVSIVLLLFAIDCHAQIDSVQSEVDELFTRKSQKSLQAFPNQPSVRTMALEINHSVLSKTFNRKSSFLNLAIPWFDNSEFSVELETVELTTDDYLLTTSEGTTRKKDKTRFFRGKSQDGVSDIALTISDKEIQIFILRDKKVFEVNKIRNTKTSYVLFESSELKSDRAYDCFTHDTFNASGTQELKESYRSSRKSTPCIPIYIETDKATYDHFNQDIDQVELYFTSLFNEVALLYQLEGIDISLSGLHVVTDPNDDFSSGMSNVTEVIEGFAEKVKNNYFGRLAHFVTTRNLLGGIAWTGTLCSEYDVILADLDGDGTPETHHYGPYAVSSAMGSGINSIPVYSWDVAVFAHELGHNLGSAHTHSCSWGANNLAIDNCFPTEGGCGLIQEPTPMQELGTIMSYCHLTSTGIDLAKGLGTMPGDLIRAAVAGASCILSCDVEPIPGCTDDNYHNYHAYANIDDGSCEGTCFDGLKNGDETGKDCGGELCDSCLDICELNYLKIEIVLDGHPTETSGVLKDSLTGAIIESFGPFPVADAYDTLFFEFCLPDGVYSFSIFDQFGDGICCTAGNGYFKILNRSNSVIDQGDSFGSEYTTHFEVILDDECPTMVSLTNQSIEGMYTAEVQVVSSGNSTSSGNVTFMAPEILMSEYFLDAGATFEAYSEGCSN